MTSLVEIPSTVDPDARRGAEAMVREYCGWHIAPSRTETLTVDGSGTRLLMLPSLKITAITSIVEDGVTLTADEFTWSEAIFVERKWSRWTSKRRAIEVTLTHGYTVCPDAVRDVVKHLAQSGPGSAPVARAGIGQVSVSYSEPSPSFAALDRYRIPSIA